MSAVVDAARGWLGVKWRHCGRTREAGVDCIGLVIVAAGDAGLALPDPAPYARQPEGHALLTRANDLLTRVSPADARPGDVLLFRYGGLVSHVGLRADRAGQPTVIHALARRRCVVEEPLAHDLADSLVAAFRLPGA